MVGKALPSTSLRLSLIQWHNKTLITNTWRARQLTSSQVLINTSLAVLAAQKSTFKHSISRLAQRSSSHLVRPKKSLRQSLPSLSTMPWSCSEGSKSTCVRMSHEQWLSQSHPILRISRPSAPAKLLTVTAWKTQLLSPCLSNNRHSVAFQTLI